MLELRLSSIVRTVLLLPICGCATLRYSSKHPLGTVYNKSTHILSKQDTWQKTARRWMKYDEVVVNSFDMGITALAIAGALKDQTKFPQLDPTLAYYHTTAWRWTLRQLSLYPDLFYKKFFEFHKVWRRRFHYEDVFVPHWLKSILVWVNNTSWDTEEDMTRRYNIFSKSEFDKNDRYPPKKFVSKESFSNSTSIFYPGPF